MAYEESSVGNFNRWVDGTKLTMRDQYEMPGRIVKISRSNFHSVWSRRARPFVA